MINPQKTIVNVLSLILAGALGHRWPNETTDVLLMLIVLAVTGDLLQ